MGWSMTTKSGSHGAAMLVLVKTVINMRLRHGLFLPCQLVNWYTEQSQVMDGWFVTFSLKLKQAL